MAAPVPAGWRVRLAHGTRVLRDAGAIGGPRSALIGGSPLRLLTLSPRGAQLISGWLAGQPIGEDRAERLLARRLLDAGLVDPDPTARSRNPSARLRNPRADPPAHPPNPSADPPVHPSDPQDAPPGPHPEPELTIVIPVYADPDRLRACLSRLAHDGMPVIVVDDGSPDAGATAAAAGEFGTQYVRHRENRGPSAARNTGLATATTPFVAFLDADCLPPPDFPGRLLDHLVDPAIALAAPRVVTSARQSGPIAAYERCRSALDMGARPSLVRPYSPVWYVPSAAMVARRDALGAGFDEGLSLGEDVDLVWRLHDAGWQVRYDPAVTVEHEDRVRPTSWYRRRVAYNESVAPLLRRHPERVPVLFLAPSAALAWASAAAGWPAPVLALAGLRAARLRQTVRARLPGAGPWAARAAIGMTAREARDLGRALAGPWAPFALAALSIAGGRRRRRLACRLAAPIAGMAVADWIADRPRLDPLTYVALRLADESSRGVGIWLGCVRARDFRSLLPRRPPPASRR